MSSLTCILECEKGHRRETPISKIIKLVPCDPTIKNDQESTLSSVLSNLVITEQLPAYVPQSKRELSKTREIPDDWDCSSEEDEPVKSASSSDVSTSTADKVTEAIMPDSVKLLVDTSAIACDICAIEGALNYNKRLAEHVKCVGDKIGPEGKILIKCNQNHTFLYNEAKKSKFGKFSKPGCLVCNIDYDFGRLALNHLTVVKTKSGNLYTGFSSPVRVHCSRCKVDFFIIHHILEKFIRPLKTAYFKTHDELEPPRNYVFRHSKMPPGALLCSHKHEIDRENINLQILSDVRMMFEIFDNVPYDDFIPDLYDNQPTAYSKEKNLAVIHLALYEQEEQVQIIKQKCVNNQINLIQIPKHEIRPESIIMYIVNDMLKKNIFSGNSTKAINYIYDGFCAEKQKGRSALLYTSLA